MPSDDSLQVTSPDQWKGIAAEGNVIPLPSGNNVRVKRTMDLIDLMKQGRIPNPLAPIVQKMVSGGKTDLQAEDLTPDSILEMLNMVDECVVKSVTEPKIQMPPAAEDTESTEDYQKRIATWTADPGFLPITFLTVEDRMYIFAYAQGFAADLDSFREETTSAMARLSGSKAVPKPTKRTGRRT